MTKAHTAAGKVDLTKNLISRMMMWPGIPSLKCIIPTLTYVSHWCQSWFGGALTPNDADGRLLFYLKSRTFSNTANDGRGFSPSLVTKFHSTCQEKSCWSKQNVQLAKWPFYGHSRAQQRFDQDQWYLWSQRWFTAYSGSGTQADVLPEIYRNRCIELLIPD